MIEAGNMVILTMPTAVCDVNFLTPLQEYLLRGLETRCLVLPREATLEVRSIPAIGAAKVAAQEEKPKRKGGRPKKAPAEAVPLAEAQAVPKAGTAPVPESGTPPTPTVFREKAVPKRPAPRRARSKLPFEDDILPSYRQAANRRAQIKILADLNGCTEERIRDFLEDAGEELPDKAKAGAHG